MTISFFSVDIGPREQEYVKKLAMLLPWLWCRSPLLLLGGVIVTSHRDVCGIVGGDSTVEFFQIIDFPFT